jgi:hypothetical protein
MRRSNLLIASSDILSADMAGASILGHKPESVLYLVHAAKNRNRPLDLSDIEIVGEKIENVAALHEWDFLYTKTKNGEIPTPMTKDGIEGLFYRKFDSTMCTYCSGLNGLMLSAIRYAWKGEPWDRVELLTGKKMKPTAGMNKTILMGKCMVQAHKDNPDIKEMIPIKGCPPKIKDMINALHKAGIDANPALFEQIDQLPGFFMSRYAGKPEFEESFYRIEQEG